MLSSSNTSISSSSSDGSTPSSSALPSTVPVFSGGNSSAARVDAHRDTCAATTTIMAVVASNPAHGTQSPNPTPSRSDEDAETGNPIHKSRQLVISQRTRRVALGALARLRKLVRDGDHQLASRLGVSFMVWSLVDNLELVFVLITGNWALCSHMTRAVSISAFLLHFSLALAHDGLHFRCAIHYCLIVSNSLISGVDHLVRGEIVSAAYLLLGWGIILFPLGALGLRRVLHAAPSFTPTKRVGILHSTFLAFAGSAMPILYFF